MLKFIIFIFSYSVPGNSIEKGQPVPHAEELHKILSHFITGFNATQPGSIIDFILTGNGNINPNMDLDTNILDPAGIKKIVQKAWNENRDEALEDEALMWDMFPRDSPEQEQMINKIKINYRRTAGRSGMRNHFGYQQLDVVANLALRQMKQSLYSTKERIEVTAPYRAQYNLLPSYQIAFYTALVSLEILRMDHYFTTMETWYNHTTRHENSVNVREFNIHFLWYLIVYEKILAYNVDVTDNIRRIYAMNQQHLTSKPSGSP